MHFTNMVGQHAEVPQVGTSHPFQAPSPSHYGISGDKVAGPRCQHVSGRRGRSCHARFRLLLSRHAALLKVC